MSKEKFISFAKVHPEFAKEVISGKVSWQQLYEIYEIYGENHSIWNQYMNNNNFDFSSFKDIFNTIKNVDFDKVQSGIQNVQKTIGLLQDIGVGSTEKVSEPIYKRFL